MKWKTLVIKMNLDPCGFCPSRIEKRNFQAGCVLIIGKDSLCYSQDIRPLFVMKEIQSGEKIYHCPLLKFHITEKTYKEIEQILDPILAIQDEENIGINLWPIFSDQSKITNPIITLKTKKGRQMMKLSNHVREELQQIVLNFF